MLHAWPGYQRREVRNPCWRRGARAKDLLSPLESVTLARALLLQQGATHPLKTTHTFSIANSDDSDERNYLILIVGKCLFLERERERFNGHGKGN